MHINVMKIVYDSMIRVYKAKEETLDTFREELEFKNPDRGLAEAMIKRGSFIPELPPKWVRCYEEHNDHLAIPSGCGIDFIKRIAHQHKELIQIVDERSLGHEIDFSIPTRGHFRAFDEHQKKLIQNAVDEPNSVASCPTGGGKTVAAFGMIEKIGRSTIVLVDRKDLMVQWLDELEEKCDGSFTIGQLGAGKKKLGDVTVAMVQTLTRLPLKAREDIEKQFGILIVDEVHKASAPTFVEASSMFATKFKLGLSATPYRQDKKDFVFKSYIGQVTIEITDKEVEDAGRIVPMKYEFVDTGYQLDFGTIEEEVANFPKVAYSDFDRCRFIVDCVKMDLEMGFTPFIVAKHVAFLRNLYKLLKEDGISVGIVTGSVKDKDRKRIKQEMKDGYLQVLVANESIFGTGIDIPILSSVHVPYRTNNKGLLKQFCGRARRGYSGKTYAKIVYYRDDVFTLETNKRTLQTTKVASKSFTNCYKSVRGYFRRWGFTEETENTIL